MVAFSLGSIHIYRYGIAYFLGFLGGYLFFLWITKKNIFGTSFPRLQSFLQTHLDDFMLCIFFGVLLGGRLGHILIYDFSYYLAHPGEMFQVRRGGMSFIGGIFGVTLFLGILAWKNRLTRKDLLLLGDLIFAVLPFGIMLGRIGNFLNQELYGIVVSNRLPTLGYPLFSFFNQIGLFHVYPQVDEFLRVNTNLLSSFFEGLLLLIITLSIIRTRVHTKKVQAGKIVATFLIGYSFIRFFLEYLRADSQLEFHGRFSISQRFFIGFFAVGVAILLFRKKIK